MLIDYLLLAIILVLFLDIRLKNIVLVHNCLDANRDREKSLRVKITCEYFFQLLAVGERADVMVMVFGVSNFEVFIFDF